MSLAELGWGPPFADAFAPLSQADPTLLAGRVSIEHRGRLQVITTEGTRLAWPPEGVRYESDDPEHILARPRVGDWVAVKGQQAEPRILHVLPRRTALLRQVPRKKVSVQVVAANLDRVFVVSAWGRDLSPRRIERFLAAIQASGAKAEIIVHKVDLADPGTDVSPHSLLGQLASDLPVHLTSTITGQGIDALRDSVQHGETVGLVGTSGAGKSSLVNALCGRDSQAVAAVRAADAKGRHTTTHRELVRLPGRGVLLDTPGMRELQLWDGTGLKDTFADLDDLARTCRWRGCRHQREDGCAIQRAIAEGSVDKGRVASWRKLHAEAKATTTRRKRRRDRRKP